MVWRELTKESLDATKQQFAYMGYVGQWYAMASEVILTTLGPEWWRKNLSPQPGFADEFLAVSDDNEDAKYNHQDRVTRLGDMLYLLRACKGYQVFISSLQRRDLSPTFFELFVATLLYRNGFRIEFVQETGHKGEDYDLRADRAEVLVNVEAKTRRSGVVLGENKLRNTLEQARSQLPTTGPNIIFVSIPNEWTRESNAESVIDGCVGAFFRSSARINYVIVIWQEWFTVGTSRGSASLVREYVNKKARTRAQLGTVINPLPVPASLDPERPLFVPSFW